MNHPKSESSAQGLPVSQVYTARNVWIEEIEDSTGVRVQDHRADAVPPPLTEEERAELEACIAQTRERPSAALREAVSEIDKLLAELGDAGEPMSSIRERICRIRTLLAEG